MHWWTARHICMGGFNTSKFNHVHYLEDWVKTCIRRYALLKIIYLNLSMPMAAAIAQIYKTPFLDKYSAEKLFISIQKSKDGSTCTIIGF